MDLVTSSASGLDPDVSMAAADYQIDHAARYRVLSRTIVSGIVDRFTEGRQLGILVEPRVNALKLYLAPDD